MRRSQSKNYFLQRDVILNAKTNVNIFLMVLICFRGGPKFDGYYGVVTTKLSPGYFKKTIEDDIELF